MFQLIQDIHLKEIKQIVIMAKQVPVSKTVNLLFELVEKIRADIPEKKRISYGRYSIITDLGLKLYPELQKADIDIFNFADEIYEDTEKDPFVRSLAVQLISITGLEITNLERTQHFFEQAATDDSWEVRECSAGFIRKLIQQYPFEMKKWYLKQVESSNPLQRRFASESIRPVADNKWFLKNPDFCFTILEKLYFESDPYPRTSVGNNLSDWARTEKERVYTIVQELVQNKDKNSYWIAYRACRNLVKKEPIRVMDLLGVDEYKYKSRIHFRKDYL
jgi:3-methyladenine DNA glycosylase AlkC